MWQSKLVKRSIGGVGVSLLVSSRGHLRLPNVLPETKVCRVGDKKDCLSLSRMLAASFVVDAWLKPGFRADEAAQRPRVYLAQVPPTKICRFLCPVRRTLLAVNTNTLPDLFQRFSKIDTVSYSNSTIYSIRAKAAGADKAAPTIDLCLLQPDRLADRHAKKQASYDACASWRRRNAADVKDTLPR